MNRALAFALWAILSATIGIMLIAYALPQDLGKTTKTYATLVAISFFGRVLTFHVGMFLVIVALIALALRRRWLAMIAALVGILLVAPTAIALWPHDGPQSTGPSLRLMSMNLKYTHANPELIVDQIRMFRPDVMVVQDYTPFAEKALLHEFGHDYPHRLLEPNTLQGLAIFSKFSFDGNPVTVFTKTRRQLRAVVMFNAKPMVIYVEHPFSPRTRQRIINNRLATLDLAQQVRNEKGPVIVAGDFNFTTETPNAQALKATGLQDSFELAGHGRGSTWSVQPQWMQWLPGVRIDHIFISPDLTCTKFLVGSYDGSDHLPIIADIATAR